MKKIQYQSIARYFPALICSIPFLILGYYGLNPYFYDLFKAIGYWKIAGNLTVIGSLVYFLAQICRIIGKEVFERKYFKNQTTMPTTEILLHSNNFYSEEYKEKIRLKIEKDFCFKLLDKKAEGFDENLARKKIVEAVGLIRNKVKNGRLLLQHNIEYGFFRNLVGGSVVGLVISILNIFIFRFKIYNTKALLASILLAVIFGFLLTIRRFLIYRLGQSYAERLFSEYITMA